MPNNCIDLIITSPPYDNLMTYKGYSFDYKITGSELYRVTKQGGVVVWIVGDATIKGNETGTSFKQVLHFQSVGFNLHDTMIWEKLNPMPSFKAPRYNQCFEYMFVFSKDTPKTFNPIMEKCKTAGQLYSSVKVMGNRSNPTRKILSEPKRKKEFKVVGNIWKPGHATRNYGHPAVFPESLVEKHITTWSNPNDIVYDPFMGSGTTAIVSKRLNRQYIGSEISKEYCYIINARLEAEPPVVKVA
jgi:site-specific DNA-methyltransferase (adenine-specific)